MPNLIHDAHDVKGANDRDLGIAKCADSTALKQADDWLRDTVGPLVQSTIFKEKGLLVIVFDEACNEDESDGSGHQGGGARTHGTRQLKGQTGISVCCTLPSREHPPVDVGSPRSGIYELARRSQGRFQHGRIFHIVPVALLSDP